MRAPFATPPSISSISATAIGLINGEARFTYAVHRERGFREALATRHRADERLIG